MTKRTAIPGEQHDRAHSLAALLGRPSHIRIAQLGLERTRPGSVARRRVAGEIGGAFRAPLLERARASTAASAALSFTRRMSSSIASPSRGGSRRGFRGYAVLALWLGGRSGLVLAAGIRRAEPSSSLRAPSVMRPRSRSRAAPADWPGCVLPFAAGDRLAPFAAFGGAP